jgi:hypothetical protein
MILILIESPYAFTIYDKNFIWRFTSMLFNFYWLCPNPKTLKIIRRSNTYFCAWIDSWTNTKAALIGFVKDDTIQKK